MYAGISQDPLKPLGITNENPQRSSPRSSDFHRLINLISIIIQP